MLRHKPLVLFVLLAVFVITSIAPAQAKPLPGSPLDETPDQHNQRMQWWRQARFGMFIHWGLYAVPAGVHKGKHYDNYGEWIMALAKIDPQEYTAYSKMFNPAWYDADQWAQIAQDAGMKYMVITSKHHDGFSIYDSACSEYDIIDTAPYGKDPIAPLAAACKKRGIKFAFYYSILDWHHPAQKIGKHENGAPHYAKTDIVPGRKQEYIDYMKCQVKELIEKYDPAVMWFDGEWVDWWTKEDGRDMEAFCRRLKPDIITNNRVGKRDPDDGDFGTPEQEIPDTGLDYDWETCMTLNKTWGFKAADQDWKSSETLLKHLVDITSKGGNFLLNVGPTLDGSIPVESVDILKEMGTWLKTNGPAVYGTTASPFEKPQWGRYTRKGSALYAHIFDWPESGNIEVPMLDSYSRIKSVKLLKNSQALDFSSANGRAVINLPGENPDTPITVIEINFE